MRCFRLVPLLLVTLCAPLPAQSNSTSFQNHSLSLRSTTLADPATQSKIAESYGKLPLSFEANQGQTDNHVKFLSRTSAYTIFLTRDEAVIESNGKTANLSLRMRLRNADPNSMVSGEDRLAGTSNYFIGNDPAKWRSSVPMYAKVKYEGIYPGINLVYYGNHQQLEYDFIVAPGADPSRIAFDVNGAERIRLDARGDLVFEVNKGEIRWRKPVVYQEGGGTRQLVAAHYAVTGATRVTFELAKYDTSKPLYIDPLVYSTYLGSSLGRGDGYGIAVDGTGNAYVTGATDSTDFPITPGALQPTCKGNCSDNAFVTKFNPAGSALVYSTYLGGSNSDWSYGIAVDNVGDAFVTGRTWSTDFPTTPGAFQATCDEMCQGAGDGFVTQISPTGSALVYSTYLGGIDGSGWGWCNGIAVDGAGNAYVTGSTTSTDFPTTPGAFETTGIGGFVTKFTPSGSLAYSTYLQASYPLGITVDSAGEAYLTGGAADTGFPTTPGAFETTGGGGFVTKFNATGSALLYSTYLNNSTPSGIAVDRAGDAYVTGYTCSGLPTTPGVFQAAYGGGSCKYYGGDAFVTKFNPTGSTLIYSTYLGEKGTTLAQPSPSIRRAMLTSQAGPTQRTSP